MNEKELRIQQKQEVQQAGEPTKPEKNFMPAVDIFESDKAVTVLAEMPGVDKNGIEIGLEDGVLTIRGTREKEEAGDRILLEEYESGNYLRRFSVAETIDQEKIEATIVNGILKIVLPKIEPAKPRKITVNAA